LGNPTATDADGFLADIDVQDLNEVGQSREDKWQDLDQFFSPRHCEGGQLQKEKNIELVSSAHKFLVFM
jgi:hypothetical protein